MLNKELGLERITRPRGHGRFMQTDPIGYQAGLNLYGYVGGDPVNLTDPSGLCTTNLKGYCYSPIDPSPPDYDQDIVVTGTRPVRPNPNDYLLDDRRQSVSDRTPANSGEQSGGGGGQTPDDGEPIVVTARPIRRPPRYLPPPTAAQVRAVETPNANRPFTEEEITRINGRNLGDPIPRLPQPPAPPPPFPDIDLPDNCILIRNIETIPNRVTQSEFWAFDILCRSPGSNRYQLRGRIR